VPIIVKKRNLEKHQFMWSVEPWTLCVY